MENLNASSIDSNVPRGGGSPSRVCCRGLFDGLRLDGVHERALGQRRLRERAPRALRDCSTRALHGTGSMRGGSRPLIAATLLGILQTASPVRADAERPARSAAFAVRGHPVALVEGGNSVVGRSTSAVGGVGIGWALTGGFTTVDVRARQHSVVGNAVYALAVATMRLSMERAPRPTLLLGGRLFSTQVLGRHALATSIGVAYVIDGDSRRLVDISIGVGHAVLFRRHALPWMLTCSREVGRTPHLAIVTTLTIGWPFASHRR